MLLVLEQMAERIADGPRPTDPLADALLAAEAFQPDSVIPCERLIVPANCPANLGMIGVDPAGGVVGRRNADSRPIREAAQVAELSGQQADDGPRLPFELH